MFEVRTDHLCMILNFYDEHPWLFKDMKSAIFMGIKNNAEEMPIIREMAARGCQTLCVEAWRLNAVNCVPVCYPSLMLNTDMCSLHEAMVDKSVDMIWAKQVLEHVPQETAMMLLAKWKRLARKMVIIETPKGAFPQGAIDDNPYEEHKAAMEPEMFQMMEYETYVGGYDWEQLRFILAIWCDPDWLKTVGTKQPECAIISNNKELGT